MTALMFRTYGVVRGDEPTIRSVALEPVDPLLALVIILTATGRFAHIQPVRWLTVAIVMATAGIALFAAAVWLVGRSLEGTGSFQDCANTAVYTWIPLMLGLISNDALVVGFALSYLVSAGVARVIHRVSWSSAAAISIIPMLLLAAGVAAVG